ncbi:AAA family ATPase [Corynebacterium casei]|uniref:AAA family ATPase n=2 Tax=Corynebacterium casei TaxID=160386 RepID=UPI001FCA721E|nr:AAA family ATPase [Corynebacterium casei]
MAPPIKETCPNPELVEILSTVKAAGARTVLVGDPEQYSAVKARSGLLATLAEELPDAVELTEVFRQRSKKEREASTWLRSGDEGLIERAAQWYADNNRVHAGSVTAMLDDALAGWAKDTEHGKQSLLIASTREQVGALNAAAQKTRADRGELDLQQSRIRLSDGLEAYIGDTILTRSNDYDLITSAGDVVRNGLNRTGLVRGHDVTQEEHHGYQPLRPGDPPASGAPVLRGAH